MADSVKNPFMIQIRFGVCSMTGLIFGQLVMLIAEANHSASLPHSKVHALFRRLKINFYQVFWWVILGRLKGATSYSISNQTDLLTLNKPVNQSISNTKMVNFYCTAITLQPEGPPPQEIVISALSVEK